MAKIKATEKISGGYSVSLDQQQVRHNEAIDTPRGFEVPIVRMLLYWSKYADEHRKRYEADIHTADPLIGDSWVEIGQGIRKLLNGETGNLDCGTLDAFILRTLEENGFTLDDDGDPISEVR
jgi:hypothetical protein